MKESKLSQEITQVIIVLVGLYIVVIIAATIFIQSFYVDWKFSRLEDFYTQNQSTLTEEELIDYAENQGFTHTIQSKSAIQEEALNSILNPDTNFSTYSQYLDTFNRLAGNHDEPDQLVATKFDNVTKVSFYYGDDLITLSLNSSITNDIIFITILLAAVTSILFLTMLISVNTFINRRVGKPLDRLSTYIDDIANLNTTTEPLDFSHDDEIKKIGDALMSMKDELNREIVNRNELLRAITHELKTPLAHIITLLYLHKNEVDEYKDFDFVESQIQNIISENNELIQVTLSSLESTDKLKQEFNLKPLIESKLKTFDVYLNGKEVISELNSYELEANPVPLNLILNNLLLNASKYSSKFLKVSNKDSIITIENDYVDNAGNGVGKTIINRLSEFENYTIEVTEEEGIYTTIINLNS